MNYNNCNYANRIKMVCGSSTPEVFLFLEDNYYMLEFIYSKISKTAKITPDICRIATQSLFQYTKLFRLCCKLQIKMVVPPPQMPFIFKHLLELFTVHSKTCDMQLSKNPEILHNFLLPLKVGQIYEDMQFFTLKKYYSEYLKDSTNTTKSGNLFVDAFLGLKFDDKFLFGNINCSCSLLLFCLEVCSRKTFLTYNDISTKVMKINNEVFDDPTENNKPSFVILNQIMYTLDLSFKRLINTEVERDSYIQKIVATLTQAKITCLENLRHYVLEVFNCWIFNLVDSKQLQEEEINFLVEGLYRLMENTYFNKTCDAFISFENGIVLPMKNFNGKVYEFFVFMCPKVELKFTSLIKRVLGKGNDNCAFLCLRVLIHLLENDISSQNTRLNIIGLCEFLKDPKYYFWKNLALTLWFIRANSDPIKYVIDMFQTIDWAEDFVIFITFIFHKTLYARQYLSELFVKRFCPINRNLISVLILLYGPVFILKAFNPTDVMKLWGSKPITVNNTLKFMAWKKATSELIRVVQDINIKKNLMGILNQSRCISNERINFGLEKYYLTVV